MEKVSFDAFMPLIGSAYEAASPASKFTPTSVLVIARSAASHRDVSESVRAILHRGFISAGVAEEDARNTIDSMERYDETGYALAMPMHLAEDIARRVAPDDRHEDLKEMFDDPPEGQAVAVVISNRGIAVIHFIPGTATPFAGEA